MATAASCLSTKCPFSQQIGLLTVIHCICIISSLVHSLLSDCCLSPDSFQQNFATTDAPIMLSQNIMQQNWMSLTSFSSMVLCCHFYFQFSALECDGRCWHQKADIFNLFWARKWECCTSSVFLPRTVSLMFRNAWKMQFNEQIFERMLYQTRSHPEMVGDMSCVTLNFDLSKIPFVHF